MPSFAKYVNVIKVYLKVMWTLYFTNIFSAPIYSETKSNIPLENNFEVSISADNFFVKNWKMKKKNEVEKMKNFSTGWKIINWHFLEYLNLADFEPVFRFFVFSLDQKLEPPE